MLSTKDQSAAADAAAVVLTGASPLAGDYMLIAMGAIFGAWVLACRTTTATRLEVAQVMGRAIGVSMLFTLAVAKAMEPKAQALGMPLELILTPLAGFMAIIADDLLNMKDKILPKITELIVLVVGRFKA